jgi:hypothetical protein
VAVFRLEARSAAVQGASEAMTEFIVDHLRAGQVFTRVVGPGEVTSLLSKPQQDELVRCVRDRTALVDMEMAGALGVTHLLLGTVTRLDDLLIVALTLLDLRSAREVNFVVEGIRAPGDVVPREVLGPPVRHLVAPLALPPGVDAEAVGVAPGRGAGAAWPRRAVAVGVGLVVHAVGGLGVVVATLVVTMATLLGLLPYVVYVPTPGASVGVRRTVFPGVALMVATPGLLLAGAGGLLAVVGAGLLGAGVAPPDGGLP